MSTGLHASPPQPETDAVIDAASPKPTYAVFFLMSYVYTVYQARMKLSPRITELGSPPGMIALMHSIVALPSELWICSQRSAQSVRDFLPTILAVTTFCGRDLGASWEDRVFQVFRVLAFMV